MACAGPITSSRPTVGAALDSASDTLLDRLRAIYDSGFAHVMAAVPDSAAEPGLWPLWALGRFKRNAVSWARLIGNGYYPLQEGPAAAGWLAIVPPGHRMLRSMPSGLALDPSPTIHVVRIRPDEVTPTWAGLFLVHEVMHLADRALGAEPPRPTRHQFLMSEFRAYELELLAADRLSAGRLRLALDIALDVTQPTSLQSLVSEARALAAAQHEAFAALISPERPNSSTSMHSCAPVVTVSHV